MAHEQGRQPYRSPAELARRLEEMQEQADAAKARSRRRQVDAMAAYLRLGRIRAGIVRGRRLA